MSCTYDVLRAAGLAPELTCAGCGNKISAHVVPWSGEGYVTHPNNRCESSAFEKELRQKKVSELIISNETLEALTLPKQPRWMKIVDRWRDLR